MNEIVDRIAVATGNPIAIGIVLIVFVALAALIIWHRIRGLAIYEAAGIDPRDDDDVPEALSAESIPAPAIVPARVSPLIVRMHERLAAAYRSKDRAEILRQQSHLVRSGYEPPPNLADCADALDAQIFTKVKQEI